MRGRHKSTKSYSERFLESKHVITILGENYGIDTSQEYELQQWFAEYDFRKSMDWFKQVARWIKWNQSDWVSLRKQIEANGPQKNNLKNYILRYGPIQGAIEFKMTLDKKPKLTTWFQEQAVIQDISEHTVRSNSAKATVTKRREEGNLLNSDVWRSQGFTEKEIKDKLSKASTRDLSFFQEKYGEQEGLAFFSNIKQKRKDTWGIKDKHQHALVTIPKSFNPTGLEMQALNLFIDTNNLQNYRLQLGAPADQFFQWIPNIGYRRYDLAVWDNDQLRYIVEFHGLFHINFSDFSEEMRGQAMLSNGKELTFAPTYGHTYDNDQAKRNHILTKFPEAKYIVIWPDDLKKKRLHINELLTARKDRLSTSILQ
jgi:hypothetical protein